MRVQFFTKKISSFWYAFDFWTLTNWKFNFLHLKWVTYCTKLSEHPKSKAINGDLKTAEWAFVSAVLSRSVSYIIYITFKLLLLPCNKSVSENILNFSRIEVPFHILKMTVQYEWTWEFFLHLKKCKIFLFIRSVISLHAFNPHVAVFIHFCSVFIVAKVFLGQGSGIID